MAVTNTLAYYNMAAITAVKVSQARERKRERERELITLAITYPDPNNDCKFLVSFVNTNPKHFAISFVNTSPKEFTISFVNTNPWSEYYLILEPV
jgi:hypothetical protein